MIDATSQNSRRDHDYTINYLLEQQHAQRTMTAKGQSMVGNFITIIGRKVMRDVCMGVQRSILTYFLNAGTQFSALNCWKS